MMPRSAMVRTGMAFATLAVAAAPCAAEPVAEFYSGKQIRFIIRSGAGGGYDSYSRLLGRHMVKHIPGRPQIIHVNMPGGGGIRAANHVAKIAPQDGTVLTIVSQGLPVDQALGLNPSFQADLRDFHWIGNLSSSNQVMVTWHTSPTKSLADAMRRETVIGTTQAGSIATQLPAVYNNLLGTKLKIVYGYPGGTDINLAMERGEVEGRATNPWASYVSVDPHFIAQKLIVPILQAGMQKEPDLPHVPLLRELARNPSDQPVLDFISKSVAVGRPVATTPGVPAERVAALRKAFEDTLKDPDFIKEAAAQRAEIQPMSGAELAQIVRQIIEASPELRERVRAAIQPTNATQLPGAKAGGE
jgi:tripartite-type tricarboxylate transporter receptor subunit TctC